MKKISLIAIAVTLLSVATAFADNNPAPSVAVPATNSTLAEGNIRPNSGFCEDRCGKLAEDCQTGPVSCDNFAWQYYHSTACIRDCEQTFVLIVTLLKAPNPAASSATSTTSPH